MPRFRPTARLIVLDPAGRVLLFSADDPRGRFWFTPGGGVRAGESLEEAAARELAEETSHVTSEVGPVVATRAGLWSTSDGAVFFGADAYFLIRVNELSVDTGGQEELERSVITGHRWWTAGEIRASEEVVLPPGLAELIEQLLCGGLAAPVRLPW